MKPLNIRTLKVRWSSSRASPISRRTSFIFGCALMLLAATGILAYIGSFQAGGTGPSHGTRLVFAALAFTGFALLCFVYFLTKDDMRRRQTAEDRLRASERRFRTVTQSVKDAIICADANDAILFWNRAAETTFGYTETEVLGLPLTIIMPERYREIHQRGLDRARKAGKYRLSGRTVEMRGLRKDGSEFPAELSMSSWDDPSEGRIHCGVVRDITERKKSEASLRESEDRFRSIFQNSTTGLYRTTPDGEVVMCNPALLAMLGLTSFEDLAGRNLNVDPVGASPAERARFAACMERDGEVNAMEFRWTRCDGTPIYVRESARPRRDAEGRTMYFEGTVEDITDRRLAKEALAASEQRFRTALESLNEGVVLQDAAGAITSCNASAERILGLTTEQLIGRTSRDPRWQIIQEDGTPLDGDAHPAMLALTTGQTQHGVVMGVRRPDGDTAWLSVNSVAIFQNGESVSSSVVSTFVDITQSRKAHAELERYKLLASYSKDSMVFVHRNGRLMDMNTAARRMYGYTRDEVENLTIFDLRAPEFREEAQSVLRGALLNGMLLETVHVRKDGTRFDVEISAQNAMVDGDLVLLGVVRDITERKLSEARLHALNARLEVMALEDALTGLNNRRAFMQRLEEEFQRAARYGSPLSVLLLDVDRFKQYNDAFGHLAGDEVLRGVGSLMLMNAREPDVSARYGGEEFAVVLPNTGRDGAVAIAERLRAAMEAAQWAHAPVTASFGVATCSPATPDIAALIEEADAALYRSKETGRNRVSHASDGSSGHLEEARFSA